MSVDLEAYRDTYTVLENPRITFRHYVGLQAQKDLDNNRLNTATDHQTFQVPKMGRYSPIQAVWIWLM